MILAAAVLLPRLLTGSEPTDAIKLAAPHVQYRANVASATTSPWIDANGWKILRAPGRSFVYHVTANATALAAAEAFAYGANALIATNAEGKQSFGQMLDFLQRVQSVDLTAIADIGVVDDGSPATGELMNLLTRQNLLYKVGQSADQLARLNVRLGSKEYPRAEAANPHLLAHKIRAQLGDEHRSLRIYGSEVVIARLTANDRQARIYLLNYADRPVRGLRVRVRGRFAKGELQVFGVPTSALVDWTQDGDATEFTLPELNAFAIVDLLR